MKRLKYYLLILCAGAFAACTDLDIPPKNIFNEQDIFGNVEGATSYLARLYGVLPMEDFRYSFEHGFGYSGAMYRQMCCATGEAVGRDTQGFFAEPGSNMWDAAYKTIREINLLIEGLPKYKSGFSDSDYNTVLGEAYFIRAYVYFAMVKRLGGVPKIDYVIDYPANATLEDTWTPRASEEVLGLYRTGSRCGHRQPARQERFRPCHPLCRGSSQVARHALCRFDRQVQYRQ